MHNIASVHSKQKIPRYVDVLVLKKRFTDPIQVERVKAAEIRQFFF